MTLHWNCSSSHSFNTVSAHSITATALLEWTASSFLLGSAFIAAETSVALHRAIIITPLLCGMHHVTITRIAKKKLIALPIHVQCYSIYACT